MKKNEKVLAFYDECECSEAEINYRIEEAKNEQGKKKIDEEAIKQAVYEDSDLFTFHYQDFIECLNEAIKDYAKEGNYWRIDGKNLDWQGACGYKHIKAETGEELFNKIRPDTNEFTVYFYADKKSMRARISHHDCPTGSHYKILPITKQTYEKHNQI